MNNTAYNLGIQLALTESGLVKEAASSTLEGLKLLTSRAGTALKDFFTLRNVREALAALPRAAGREAPKQIPAIIARSATAKLQDALKSGVRAGDLRRMVDEARQMLQVSTGPAEVYTQAKKEFLKSLIPYATVGGGTALGLGGYELAKKVYPKAFKD